MTKYKRFYQKHKSRRKAQSRDYYMANKSRIAFKRKEKASKDWKAFRGHARLVYQATKRWAAARNVPILTQKEFLDWSLHDRLSGYPFIFSQWAKMDFPDDSPVITRHTKKKGYVLGNLIWVTKEHCGITKGQLAEKAAAADVEEIITRNRLSREHECKLKYAAEVEELRPLILNNARRNSHEVSIQREK